MDIRAEKGPWADRRLAAVNCVLGSSGSLLPVNEDWAARSLEFVPPSPLVRLISRGVHVPSPTVEDAEKLRRPKVICRMIKTATKHPPINTETNAEDKPLHLNTLIPQAP